MSVLELQLIDPTFSPALFLSLLYLSRTRWSRSEGTIGWEIYGRLDENIDCTFTKEDGTYTLITDTDNDVLEPADILEGVTILDQHRIPSRCWYRYREEIVFTSQDPNLIRELNDASLSYHLVGDVSEETFVWERGQVVYLPMYDPQTLLHHHECLLPIGVRANILSFVCPTQAEVARGLLQIPPSYILDEAKLLNRQWVESLPSILEARAHVAHEYAWLSPLLDKVVTLSYFHLERKTTSPPYEYTYYASNPVTFPGASSTRQNTVYYDRDDVAIGLNYLAQLRTVGYYTPIELEIFDLIDQKVRVVFSPPSLD